MKFLLSICAAFLLLSGSVRAQGSAVAGATMANAVNFGSLTPGQTYTDSKNNSPENGYGNDYGYPSDDIFYKFTLTAAKQVSISLCGSDFDTYLYLLDSNGNLITSNDDNGPLCPGLTSSLLQQLNAGTYYLVAEGYYMNAGNIVLNLSTPNSDQVVTGIADQMTQIFGSLETSRVPTGLLLDAAFEQTNLKYYDGTALTDSNFVDMGVFKSIYNTLRSARIHTSAAAMSGEKTLDANAMPYRQPGTIVLSGLLYKYSKFTDDAVQAGRITVANNKVMDKYNGGVWQNPYETKNVFAVAAVNDVFVGQTQQFRVPGSVWFTNMAPDIAYSDFDAGDGQGYRPIGIDQNVQVTYADTGAKTVTFRLRLADNTILMSRLQFRLIKYPTAGVTFTSTITSTETFNGEHVTGYITIKPHSSSHVQNPFIVAEGFDPGHILDPEYFRGESTIETFLTKVSQSNDSTLKEDLINNPKYDIIYIDWKNGTDDIKKNALLFKEVIRQVNAMKASAGVTQPNIVMGQSMGGLIARWGLKDMENHNEDHQTNLYISDDSPHQGANAPLGYQYMANHFKHLYVNTGGTAALVEAYNLYEGKGSVYDILNLSHQAAARQMLINYVDDNDQIDNSVHDQWQADLRNMGYPVGMPGRPLRKVAISNGSQCSNPQANKGGNTITPGINLLSVTGNIRPTLLGDFLGFIPALSPLLNQPALSFGLIPGSNSSLNINIAVNAVAAYGGNVVYTNHITYKKKVLFLIPVTVDVVNVSKSAPNGSLPYETYAGGNATTDDYTGEAGYNPIRHHDLYDNNVYVNLNSTLGFVPIPSALDIGSGNTTLTDFDYTKVRYSGSYPPSAPNNSPFANFSTVIDDASKNESHLRLFATTAKFLANELKAMNGVSPDCTLSTCGELKITGPAVYCGPSTFSLNTVPNGAVIQWAVTSPAMITGGQGTSSVQITSPTKTFTVSVSMSSNCPFHPQPYTASKDIIELSAANITIKEFPDRVNVTPCPGYTRQFHFLYNGQPIPSGNDFGITSVSLVPTNSGAGTLQVSPTSGNLWDYSAFVYATLPSNASNTTRYATLTFTDVCNQTYGTYILYRPCQGNNYAYTRAYPNPASNELNINYNESSVNENPVTIEAAYEQAKRDMPNVIMQPLDAATIKLSRELADPDINFKLFNDKGKALIDVTKKLSTKKATLDIRSIPNGTYYLHTTLNNQTEKQQILIVH